MKATIPCLAALLLAAAYAPSALAQVVYYSPALCRPLAHAPDACHPGFYQVNANGVVYGPNYYLYPPYPPVNGMPPGMNLTYLQNPALWGKVPPNGPFPNGGPGAGGASFPSHPFARGPRDFFMWNEANEDAVTRLRFPALIP